jgi:hypothetical protein
VTAILEAPEVVDGIDRAPDPLLARAVLERIVEAHPALADELVERRLVRDGLVALACASRSLSTAVVGDPALLDPLRDQGR